MRSRTPWTSEELSQLQQLAKRNFSLQVIALKIGRSAAGVDAKAAQLKIALRRPKRSYRRKGSRGSDDATGNGAPNPALHEDLEGA